MKENRFKFTQTSITSALPLATAFVIPFPIHVASIAVGVFFLSAVFLTLIAPPIERRKFPWRDTFFSLLMVFYGILFLGMLHGGDTEQGMKDLEKNCLLFVLPVLLYCCRCATSIRSVMVSFTSGCFVISLFGLSYGLFVLHGMEQQQVFSRGHIYFAEIIGSSPTYLAVYFIFIIYFLLESLRVPKTDLRIIQKAGIALSLLFALGILVFLRAQMPLLIFGTSLIFYFIIVIRRRAWAIAIILFTMVFLTLLLDPDPMTTLLGSFGRNVSTAMDDRIVLWKGVVRGIKTAPIFGAGTGNEQALINLGFREVGFETGVENSFNAHNQYLQFLTRNGIPELLSFLVILVFSFKTALKKKEYVFFMLLVTFSLFMFTESTLNAHRGLFFFFFFLSAFFYLPDGDHTGFKTIV